ncbi:MAG: hypothetical protein KBS76_00695, partial [Ruminococcus sp.]|nr:hypothetical protein [Candidatus Apopatosoma intestinale]
IGQPDSYLACHKDALAGKIRSIPAAPFYRGTGGNTGSATRISWGSVIGDHVTLAEGADIRGAVLMDGVTVGKSAIIAGAVLCPGVRVGANAVIRDGAVIGKNSVIGEDVVVESGEQIPAESAIFLAETERKTRENEKKEAENR